MITEFVDENTYEVSIYDWVHRHDDYICGEVKRFPNEDEESDLRYWMFYPNNKINHMSVGDLRKIYEFISNLNTED